MSLNVPTIGRPVFKLDYKISPKNKGEDHIGFVEVLLILGARLIGQSPNPS